MESPFSNITSSFSAQQVRQPVLENSLKDTFSVILTLDVASITTWFTCRQIKTSRTAIVRRVSAPGTSPRSSHFSSAFLFLSPPLLGLPNALEQSSPADSFAELRHHRDNQVGLKQTHTIVAMKSFASNRWVHSHDTRLRAHVPHHWMQSPTQRHLFSVSVPCDLLWPHPYCGYLDSASNVSRCLFLRGFLADRPRSTLHNLLFFLRVLRTTYGKSMFGHALHSSLSPKQHSGRH